ncbi:MMPL family transporter [Auritidibacter ignavus]|uniref:MMPL family transporter n=1 Tax=Auritidibacter ignavus TaxID=678932 RepID=A0AAJ6AGK1_9MICC|nr:MMPL family transporter [Auritidibacter ignavus]WGH92988.1 MMPL family transporter [Auritidibacter ignavus]
MAKLLNKLGLGAAARPWTVLISWLALVAIAVISFFTFGGQLQSTITIPDTPTVQVTDRLEEEFPDAAKGTGPVVFRTEDGSEFTDEQKNEIGDLLTDLDELDAVNETVNPFDTEEQRQDQIQEIEDGQQQLDDGEEKLATGREELDDAREQLSATEQELDEGQEQVDAGIEQAVAQGIPQEAAEQQAAPLQEQIDQGREQLEQARSELATQEDELDEAEQEIETNRDQLQDAQDLLDASEGFSLVSEDGTTVEAIIMFNKPPLDIEEEDREGVMAALEEAEIDGVEILPTQQVSQTIPQIIGPTEIVGMVVAAIVLFIMLGTFVTAGLPLLNALVGVGVGAVGSLAFSSVVEMVSITPVLGIMLGSAVGIDYALFIINRHRQQLKSGMDVRTSIGLANGTAGTAVLFAGSTVVIALLALGITGIPFLGLMGLVGGVCVLLAVLVALTLTPAMLSFIGPRALSKKERRKRDEQHSSQAKHSAEESDEGSSSQITGHHDPQTQPMSWTRAIVTAVASIAVLGILAIPASQMRLGLPDGSAEPEGSAAYESYMAIDDAFGPGRNGPLVVTADLEEDTSNDDAMTITAELATQISEMDGVDQVVPAGTNDDNSILALQVVPEEGPNEPSTEDLVYELRDTTPETNASDLGVAGMTSGFIDISDELAEALPVYLAVVVGLSLLIMIVVFRSLVVPLIATGGFVLSCLASMGGVVAIYQWGWLDTIFQVSTPGPVLSFLPTILIGVLFGLAMDYQLFISTGMREAYVHGSDARTAVMQGFKSGRSVVTAAAIIMISVFGGFIFADDVMIRPIGFALAFGVLLDAFVVRLLLMPALMHLVGAGAWWFPKWLDKIVPNVDVEGSSLDEEISRKEKDDATAQA